MSYLCEKQTSRRTFWAQGDAHALFESVWMFYGVSGAFSFCSNVQKMRTYSFVRICFTRQTWSWKTCIIFYKTYQFPFSFGPCTSSHGNQMQKHNLKLSSLFSPIICNLMMDALIKTFLHILILIVLFIGRNQPLHNYLYLETIFCRNTHPCVYN